MQQPSSKLHRLPIQVPWAKGDKEDAELVIF